MIVLSNKNKFMLTSLYKYCQHEWTENTANQLIDKKEAQLVLCFCGKDLLINEDIFSLVKAKFPSAEIAITSTSGQIYQEDVSDNSMVVAAIKFEKTTIKTASINIKDYRNSHEAAINLANKLPKENLTYVMIFSDGSDVNGSELVKGFNIALRKNVIVTGGLAGDDANFKSTLVGLNRQPSSGEIIAIGFYGYNIDITHGSQGGWEVFGLEKEVTKSKDNVLYEIDHKSALELYKKYLGSEAENLPASALLFPLSVIIPGAIKPVVRTILSIDEAQNSMTFAGDVPVGSKVRFMKSSIEKITDAAATAAKDSLANLNHQPNFSLLISCVGRKLVLGHQTNEELIAVKNTLGNETLIAGFYSYGEISPFNDGSECQLHNQTMSITSFYES